MPREYWEEALEGLEDPAEDIDAFLRRKLKGDTEPKALKRAAGALARDNFGIAPGAQHTVHLRQFLQQLPLIPLGQTAGDHLYPDEVDEELIEVLASEHKILRYLDLPLQHINDIATHISVKALAQDLQDLAQAALVPCVHDVGLSPTSWMAAWPGAGDW